MIITPLPITLQAPAGAPRTPGVHASGLIRGIAIEAGILKVEMVEELSLVEATGASDAWWNRLDEVAKIRIALGLAWEQWFLPQLEGVIDHPGELEVQGVYMTPDGESLDVVRGKHTLKVHECKLTYKSTNTVSAMESQFMWLCQMKAYCFGLRTRFARIYVLFVCGDYSFPISPVLKCWDIAFTQQEVDENWELLTAYRDARLGAEP